MYIHDACFLSYFEKIAHCVSGLSVCIFVVLCVHICVTGANKVEGTMSRFIGTKEILASNITFTQLKVKQGPFEAAVLILHNFFVLCYS